MTKRKRADLKSRLEHDENFMLKLGKQLSEAYAQFGDLFRFMRQQQTQLDRLRRRVEKLERKCK